MLKRSNAEDVAHVTSRKLINTQLKEADKQLLWWKSAHLDICTAASFLSWQGLEGCA